MMKTEKINTILKMLEYCSTNDECCDLDCPYYGHAHCLCDLMTDTIWCINQLIDDETDLGYEVEALKGQNKALSEKLSTSEKKLEARYDTDEERRKLLRYYIDQCAVLDHEVEDLREKLEASEKENKELKDKNYILSNSNNRLNRVTEEALRENQELREKLQYVITENDTLKHQIDHMIAQRQALGEKLSAIEAKIDKLRTTLDVTTEANVKLRHEFKNMPEKNCINCDRYDVCMTVVERKDNNYKPCSLWKKADEK